MNPRRVVLDTDVASLSIKHALPPWLLAELLGAQVAISFVTLAELTRWATMRNWGTNLRHELASWLASRPTLPYSDDVARRSPPTPPVADGHARRTTPGSAPAPSPSTCRWPP